jgi:hypothetical protein
VDQAKRDKVFCRLAGNLLDYITKLRAGEVSSDDHESLWLAVLSLSKGRQWVNHNKDVGILHFKFVGENKQPERAYPLPRLFPSSYPCPRGTAEPQPFATRDASAQHEHDVSSAAAVGNALAVPTLARVATVPLQIHKPGSGFPRLRRIPP